MTSLSSRTISMLSAFLMFSGVGAHAQNAADIPSAVLELRVAAAATGSPMTSTGGVVRLLLTFTPVDGIDVATTTPRSGKAASETVRLAGIDGPNLVWINGSDNPLSFSAATIILDSRSAPQYDDRAARAIHWPINGWPEQVGAMLRADAQADELNADLRRLVEGWLGAQTRAVTPAVLAKYLAARAMTHARADLEAMTVCDGSDDAIVGIRSRGVGEFARTGAGSEFDLLRAYGASLRLAGIPARVVTGLRVGASGDPNLHAWVEFYLHDERSRQGRWIAVDLIAQRRLAHEPPPIADPWRFFGSNNAALLPLLVGIPQPASRDSTVLTPWRVECEPPCVPLRVTARVLREKSTTDPKVAQR